MPGWDLAASVYSSHRQPDFDADWADDVDATVGARKPALAFEKQTGSPYAHAAARRADMPPGGPTFAGGDPVAPPVAPPKGDPTQGLPPGVRVPLWTPSDTPAPRSRPDAVIPWRKLGTFVVLAVLALGAYQAYPRAHAWWVARGVPADLRAYVEGKGVQYAPEGQGYSVRVPKLPVHRDSTVAPATRPEIWLTMHRSIVSGAGYQIVIRVADLRGGATLPFGITGTLVDPRIAGTERPTNVRLVDFDGKPSYEYDLGSRPPMRGRVFRRGARLFVVTVQSKGADRVLDTVMASFTPAGG
jgi:hypothetical protein